MNVVVLGAGAIGGYYGGQLARAGHGVTCFARGANLAASALTLLLGLTLPASAQKAPPCGREPGLQDSAFSLAAVNALAGSYLLVLRDTSAAKRSRVYDLVLWVNDSLRKYRYVRTVGRVPGERPLGGSGRPHPPLWADTGWSAPENGRWSVQFVQNLLQIGTIDALDGWGYMLDVNWLGPVGFTGRWTSHIGSEVIPDPRTGRPLPDAAGYFCATRVTAFSDAPSQPP